MEAGITPCRLFFLKQRLLRLEASCKKSEGMEPVRSQSVRSSETKDETFCNQDGTWNGKELYRRWSWDKWVRFRSEGILPERPHADR
ncbi:hypothetical protein SUGI_0868590 [Cryptomeria japonica]|nr:hypothetical protein SUGI_0868590 [Cryptomeria japonica]